MRIVHVNLGGPAVSVDGIAAVVDTLVEAQQSRADDVDAYTDRDFEARGALRGVLTAWRISGSVLAARPDVVHMHSVYRPAHAVLALLLRRKRVPYVVSPHSGLAAGSRGRQRWRKAAYISLFERRALAKASAVLCLTDVEGDDVHAVAPRAITLVVPNPGPTPGLEAPDVPTDGHLLTLCRFDVEQKGLDVLVEIGRRMPAVRFRVFGETDVNDPARATALMASAPPNVTFEAPVRGAQKAHLLKTASAYIQPSRWEGQSISVLEALAAGVPCIVSRYVARTLGTELAELTTVIDDDPGIAARQIAAALADRPTLTAAALRARDIVRDRYSADTICDELERAYTRAISGREPIGARR